MVGQKAVKMVARMVGLKADCWAKPMAARMVGLRAEQMALSWA